MERRTFLAVLSSVSLAGCTNSGSSTQTTTTSSTPTTRTRTPTTETPTETTTTTETTTSVPTPTITDAALLTHWSEFGDVKTNTVSAVGQGGNAILGWRYSLPIHDGKAQESFQITITDQNGNQITQQTGTDTHLTNETGTDTWERWARFDTSEWQTGTYTATILVRDEISGENSQQTTVDFTLNTPLGPDEATLKSAEPKSVTVGTQFRNTLTLANTSTRDSSIVSSVSVQYNDSDWRTLNDSEFTLNLPANGTRTHTGSPTSFQRAGTYTIRLDAINETFTIEVTE